MPNKNDLVVIILDRPREIRLGHKALKMYQSITGKSMEELARGAFNFEQIEIMLYCGMLADAIKNGEKLTIEIVADLLDEHSIPDTVSKVSIALDYAFSGNEPIAVEMTDEEKNVQIN